jgi:hypothetical protein
VAAHQARVETLYSRISTGTEFATYRGSTPHLERRTGSRAEALPCKEAYSTRRAAVDRNDPLALRAARIVRELFSHLLGQRPERGRNLFGRNRGSIVLRCEN